ncbi:DUF3718 domain-containing protein [Pseudoalteromonas xiamenensis]
MMKRLLFTCTALFGFVVTSANANNFVANDDSVATALCMAVASDSIDTLRDTLTLTRVTKNTVTMKLRCNDNRVEDFAKKHDLSKTARLLGLSLETNTSIKDLANNAPKTIYISGSR